MTRERTVQPGRRSFVRTLGLAAAAAAVLPWWLRGSRVEAKTPEIPKRLVLFFTGGSMRGLWTPVAAAGAPAPTQTAWELGVLHQALAAHKDQLVFLDGMDMRSAYLDLSLTESPHLYGSTHALCGVDRASPTLPGGPSIDQLIAATLEATPQTALRSLELVGSGDDAKPYNSATAFGRSALVPQIWDPRIAFDRVFPAPDDAERTRSVLDLVGGAADDLAKRLGSDDRAKLEQHRDTIRALELRLGLGIANPAHPLDASILAPLAGVTFAQGMGAGPGGDVAAKLYDASCDLNTQILVAALAADRTRIATLTIETPPPDVICGYTPSAFGSTGSHDLQHKVGNPIFPQSKDPGAIQIVKNMHLDQAKRFASLLAAMKAVKEPDGATLLDHSIVLWCGEIAEGAHDLHDLPWILAGSAGGQLKTGRYLKFAKDSDGHGPAHNDLLVSLANLMGVPITTFGNPACCKGPLTGLLG